MQDKIMKFLAYEGKISVVCTSTTELVEEARKIHDLSPVATAAFGRLLTISAIMGNEMKGAKDKLTVQMKGNGPLGTMLVTADNFPRVKGYVANPVVDLPLNDMGKLDVGGAVGNAGFINVIKDIGLKEPYVGICPLVSGEIAEDFAEYFAKSEQKNTAVALGVLVDKNGVKSAGGYIITPMPDATDEEIIAAAKNANAHEFIMQLPDGYNTDIGQRGVKLSGGQKQRLSLARVFLKNPPILIFDEATSALDNESEKIVQDSLEHLAKNRTTLVIAHRLSTIRNAKRILVLTEDGIAEEGTHDELMAKNGVYANFYHIQGVTA